jgi:hypothetical protein
MTGKEYIEKLAIDTDIKFVVFICSDNEGMHHSIARASIDGEHHYVQICQMIAQIEKTKAQLIEHLQRITTFTSTNKELENA